MAEYANKDRAIGDFVGTHLEGYGVFVFGASGTARCISIRGRRRFCHGLDYLVLLLLRSCDLHNAAQHESLDEHDSM